MTNIETMNLNVLLVHLFALYLVFRIGIKVIKAFGRHWQ